MSLSIQDAQRLRVVMQEGREKKHLTQAQLAEKLNCALSTVKEFENCRCSPSLENFYDICRILNLSADACIFPEPDNMLFLELNRTAAQCNERQLRILLATANAMAEDKDNQEK